MRYAVLCVVAAAMVCVAAWAQGAPGGTIMVNGHRVEHAGFIREGATVRFPALAIATALGHQATLDGQTMTLDGKATALDGVAQDGECYVTWPVLSGVLPEVQFGMQGEQAV